MYTLGIDFGTESARVVIVEADTGHEVAVAVHPNDEAPAIDPAPRSSAWLTGDRHNPPAGDDEPAWVPIRATSMFKTLRKCCVPSG